MTEGAEPLRETPASGGHPQPRSAADVAVTVLAVASSAISSVAYFLMDSTVPGAGDYSYSVRAIIGLAIAVGAAAALVWRHQLPMVVTGIAVVPPLLFVADALAALIALAALASHRRDRFLVAGTSLVFAATALATGRDAGRDPDVSLVQMLLGAESSSDQVDVPVVAVLLIAAGLTAVPVAVGLWRGLRRDLARRANTARELLATVARQDERSRIAKQMHDVLGHRLSVLSLQVGALEVSDDDRDGETTETTRTLRSTVRQCLDDLRQVLGVLQNGQSWPHTATDVAAGPQPTLADIPHLITTTRRAGLNVNVTVLVDEASAAPARLGAGAYRIVHEALTNVLRHAPRTTADVTIRGGPDVGLTIEVVNPLSSDLTTRHIGSGSGLIGIAERVSKLGGTVSTGPTSGHTFAVTTWLPWPQEP